MSGRNATGEGSVYRRKDGRLVAAAYVPITDGTYKRSHTTSGPRPRPRPNSHEMTDRAAKNVPAPPPPLTVETYLGEWLTHMKQPGKWAQKRTLTRT